MFSENQLGKVTLGSIFLAGGDAPNVVIKKGVRSAVMEHRINAPQRRWTFPSETQTDTR